MSLCNVCGRRSSTYVMIFLSVMAVFWIWTVPKGAAQTEEETSRAEQIEELLQEADAFFEKQEFIASYNLYRRALTLDSANQPARNKIYEIARVYQALEKIARQEENEEQAKLLYQHYRGIVRYLLSVLTEQLNLEFQTYGKLNLLKETGGNIKDDVMPVLQNLVNILKELKSIYEQFPREEAGTEKVVKRLNKAIEKYETKLAGDSVSDK